MHNPNILRCWGSIDSASNAEIRKILPSKTAKFLTKVAWRVPDPYISVSKRHTGTVTWKSTPPKQQLIMRSLVSSISKGNSHDVAATAVFFRGKWNSALGSLYLLMNGFTCLGVECFSKLNLDDDETLSATNLARASIVGYSKITVDGRSSLNCFPMIWVSSKIPRESSPFSISGSSFDIFGELCWVYWWAELLIKSAMLLIEMGTSSWSVSACPRRL